jgi:hypothetical protein
MSTQTSRGRFFVAYRVGEQERVAATLESDAQSDCQLTFGW